MHGSGNLELSGYTNADLASSAKGDLHFECGQGSISQTNSTIAGGAIKSEPIPASLARFDRWSGDATITNGALQLGQNQVSAGTRKHSVEASVTFGDPPHIAFPPPKPAHAEKRK
jgi:hypothetical protein